MKYYLLLLLLITFKGYAQYPFEKFTAIKYDSVTVHSELLKGKLVKRIAVYKQYKFVFKPDKDTSSTEPNFFIYRHNKLIMKLVVGVSVYYDFFDKVFVGDIDGNGLPDFKIVVGNNGSGLAGSYETKIFIFQQTSEVFKVLSFMDLFENTERDLNHDGKFEIIGETYFRYKEHAYLVFDLYSFSKGKLINVGKSFGYPIAVPFTYKMTYKPTNKIPQRILIEALNMVPEDYKELKSIK